MHSALCSIAETLHYSKTDRLKALSRTANRDRDALSILETSIRNEFSIFFFDGAFFEISPFGSIFHYFGLATQKRPSSYISFGPQLDEKFLRRLFTGIELILFKLCHIVVEGQRRDYHFESEKTRQRLRKLKSPLAVRDWASYQTLMDEIFFVRDAFAHSFVELEQIRYCQVELHECFGNSYLGHTYRDAEGDRGRIFMDDVEEILAPLVTLFISRQMDQIDKDKFERLCDRLLKSRSLTR